MAPALALLVTLAAAAPEAGDGPSMHQSPHLEGTEFILGAKVVQLNEFGEGERASGFGGGLFGETTLIPGWAEIELSVVVARVEETTVVPVDLLLKKPFHFGIICPYISLGPALTTTIHSGETDVHLGAVSVLGAYMFFTDHIGIDMEVEYSVFPGDETTHELTMAFAGLIRI